MPVQSRPSGRVGKKNRLKTEMRDKSREGHLAYLKNPGWIRGKGEKLSREEKTAENKKQERNGRGIKKVKQSDN